MEGPKFSELSSIVFTYAQHILPGGSKKFCRGFLVRVLNICLKRNLQKGNSNPVNTRITKEIQAISH